MDFKKKTIIWEDNNEPPKNYIWVKSDGNAYEFNHTTRQWEKIMSSNGSGSDDSENDEELNAFMEFFDGLDDSLKNLPFVCSMDEYNEEPLSEQNELFGNKDTASNALIFADTSSETPTYVTAFISDDLCNKLVGWCFNYYSTGDGFSPIPFSSDRKSFFVADKLPLLVEKCMVSNEIEITPTQELEFMYRILGSSASPSNYQHTLFPIISSSTDEYVIITFEENNKTYYAPGRLRLKIG